jgi:adenylate cyclase
MKQPHLPPFQRTDEAPSWRRPSAIAVNRIRLVSGLWLLLYAATHLVNHALGLISLAAAEVGRGYFLAFWRLPPVEAGLLLALLVHVALGLWKLWQRRTLRMRWYEAVQLLLAVAIPSYLAVHVLATGWLHRCCGVEDSYSYFLDRAWPDGALSQSMLTVLVWLHGIIGLHFWLRLRPWYAALQPSLLVLATLLPSWA